MPLIDYYRNCYNILFQYGNEDFLAELITKACGKLFIIILAIKLHLINYFHVVVEFEF